MLPELRIGIERYSSPRESNRLLSTIPGSRYSFLLGFPAETLIDGPPRLNYNGTSTEGGSL